MLSWISFFFSRCGYHLSRTAQYSSGILHKHHTPIHLLPLSCVVGADHGFLSGFLSDSSQRHSNRRSKRRIPSSRIGACPFAMSSSFQNRENALPTMHSQKHDRHNRKRMRYKKRDYLLGYLANNSTA